MKLKENRLLKFPIHLLRRSGIETKRNEARRSEGTKDECKIKQRMNAVITTYAIIIIITIYYYYEYYYRH